MTLCLLLTLTTPLSSTVAVFQSSGYPTRPRPLPEQEEIALAMSAAPREISANATIYVLRDGGPAIARAGSNGCTCMVSRDLHEGSLYPICFDREASTSVLHRELLELRLRVEGKSEAEVKQAVKTAFAAGRLRPPRRPAVTYMMSSRQVLFSSPEAEGRRVGAWHPHLMISLPFLTEAQLGLIPGSSVDVFQLDRSGEALAQLIVPVPKWADTGADATPQPPAPQQSTQGAAARDSLRLADLKLSQASLSDGFARALSPVLAGDAVLLLEGAPLVRGKDAVAGLLLAQTALEGVRLSWEPFRVLVSGDGKLGVSFGGSIVERRGEPPNAGRYMSVWRRGDDGAWQVAAHVQIGLLNPRQTVLPTGLGQAIPEAAGPDPFAEADRAFARMAADSGAPAAFGHWVAPDGMTFAPTGELNLGPATVRARLAEGRAGKARWEWHPAISYGAASGDLGATIGVAQIRLSDAQPPVTSYSKYLTIWQRQPDGTLKFVVDGGSSRPR